LAARHEALVVGGGALVLRGMPERAEALGRYLGTGLHPALHGGDEVAVPAVPEGTPSV
jgi:hypothetical protein